MYSALQNGSGTQKSGRGRRSSSSRARSGHQQQQQIGQKHYSHVPCKFYRQGMCQAGTTCPFSHSLNEATADQTPCRYFEKGNCRFGARCANAHILPDGTRANNRSRQLRNTVQNEIQPVLLSNTWSPTVTATSPPLSLLDNAAHPLSSNNYVYQTGTVAQSPWNSVAGSSGGSSAFDFSTDTNWIENQLRHLTQDLTNMKIYGQEVPGGSGTTICAPGDTERNSRGNGSRQQQQPSEEIQFLIDDLHQSFY
ncbi:HDR034Cp [Eremothecium sinecaudum]|uniref:HDR034Cp n=1 Tax=Eremothecium sinecaudum TaxID=45286 RepID=A0A120K291_9SACH|nr:HDR034Cp [Eremothecium sinecaudum]AMD20777.1 HDR034Cp [Eremothecium sinecaudum]